jgi:hypothetical protein
MWGYDYEYKREGVANLCMFVEPLAGKRQAMVTDRRTKIYWAQAMRELADVHCPEAETIVVVLVGLQTKRRWRRFTTADARIKLAHLSPRIQV